MASISDVEAALAGLIATTLYPSGTSAPSIVDHPVKVYPGWPDPATLDADLVERSPGVPLASHVSIYPLPAERNVTRYPVERVEIPPSPATYSLSVLGQVVTVGGGAPTPYRVHNLAVYVNGFPYVYQATTGQTAAQVAAGLQALISADYGSTIAGAAITLPDGARIGPLVVGTTGATIREVRRQERQFQIAVWSSSPISRAAVADAFDPILADTQFLALADGSQARLMYHGGREDDFTQKQRIYRRSLIYTVEYATTITEVATQIVAVTESLEDQFGNVFATFPVNGALDFSNPGNSEFLPGI